MSNASWLERLSSWLRQGPQTAARAVCFPSYRPDLVRDLANGYGALLCDFRQLRMAPLAWKAKDLPLSALDEESLAQMRISQAVILQNCEALLSLATPEGRRNWFASALSRDWPSQLILPVAIYDQDLPALPIRFTALFRLSCLKSRFSCASPT